VKSVLKIKNARKKEVVITAPPSKAHTLRSFFLAALGKGITRIFRPLMGKDQRIALESIKAVGAKVNLGEDYVDIEGVNGRPILNTTIINCGNSGVTLRFITPIIALAENSWCTVDGSKEMRKRTIKDLVDALRILNVKIDYLGEIGFPPFKIHGGSYIGGKTSLNGQSSSQFLSSMLISGACTKNGLIIEMRGDLVSKPYVDITMDVMNKFGANVTNTNYKKFSVKGNQGYNLKEITIEGDYSNSSYFFLAAAICKISVSVKNLNPKSIQGDKKVLDILQSMGCQIIENSDTYTVIGKDLHGISLDMGDFPDIVPTIAIAASFAEGVTRIKNVGHLAHKETNRLEAIKNELTKMGIEVKIIENDLIIKGGNPKGAVIETYRDHRIAMSFAVVGLKIRNIQIINPSTVEKSFPNFFSELSKFY
jgi:3-phosphoshikimate 1-carboxyvinyltransferase